MAGVCRPPHDREDADRAQEEPAKDSLDSKAPQEISPAPAGLFFPGFFQWRKPGEGDLDGKESMLFSNPVDILLPTPVHLLLLLLALTVAAFRCRVRLRRWRWLLLLATAWTWTVLTPAVAFWLAGMLEDDFRAAVPGEARFVVVLASGNSYESSLRGEYQLDQAGLRRTLAGIAAWRRQDDAALVFSGASWREEPQPVSVRMGALAAALGVPRARLIVETESVNTYENLRNIGRLLPRGEPFLLVTSALHMPRAMAVARSLGLEAHPVPCDFRARRDFGWRAWLPNSRALPLMAWTLHEWLGRGYYRLRGWI